MRYRLPKIFSCLVIAATALHALWFAQPLIHHRLIGISKFGDHVELDAFLAFLPMRRHPLRWLLMALPYLPVAVGLCRFFPPARLVFVLLTLFVQGLMFVGGVHLELAFGAVLGTLVALSDGAIIALAYASSLREKFQTCKPAA